MRPSLTYLDRRRTIDTTVDGEGRPTRAAGTLTAGLASHLGTRTFDETQFNPVAIHQALVACRTALRLGRKRAGLLAVFGFVSVLATKQNN